MLRGQLSYIYMLLMTSLEVVAEAGNPQMIALDQRSLQQAVQLFAGDNLDLRAVKRAAENTEAEILISSHQPNPLISSSFSSWNINPSKDSRQAEADDVNALSIWLAATCQAFAYQD